MKRYVSTSLAALFGLGVIACGGGDSGESSAGTPAPAPAPAAAPAPATTTTPPAAPAGGEETGSTGAIPEGATAEMVAAGQTIYSSTGLCFSCHGPTGTGVPQLGPDLTDDVWLNTDGTYEGIISTVMTGVPEPKEAVAPMMPKGGSTISDEDVRAVAAYVYSLSH